MFLMEMCFVDISHNDHYQWRDGKGRIFNSDDNYRLFFRVLHENRAAQDLCENLVPECTSFLKTFIVSFSHS